MDRNKKIIIGSLGAISIIVLLFSFRITKAGQEFDKTDAFAKLSKENPYANTAMAYQSEEDIYAKGEHIVITNSQLEWQTKVFELTDSENPEEDAYNYICRMKTLFNAAVENGYLASDEEVDREIQFNVELYEEYKKENGPDPLYEAYGGARNYEESTREVKRMNLSIENYMESLKEEFEKTLQEEDLYSGKADVLWSDRRKQIEQELIEEENIIKVY